MRTKGSKNGSGLIDQKFRAAGFVRRDEAATRLGVSANAVSKWVEGGDVRSARPSNVLYVAWVDCVRKFGVDNAVIVGAIKREDAGKYREEAAGE